MKYTIESLKKDHAEFSIDIKEIELIMDDEEINYSNLVHIFRKIFTLWDKHEKEEENLFKEFEKINIKIPIKKILFAHKELLIYKNKITKAINSGSDSEIKQCLKNEGKALIDLLKSHIDEEDNAILSLPIDKLPKLNH
jgi:hemerythrin-like domain-containing protein